MRDDLATPWQSASVCQELVETLRVYLQCPHPIAHLLVSRGITKLEDANAFLRPSLEDLHSPFLMLGMNSAVARIERAVTHGEAILIYGDYDVDGTIATVLLKTAIERTAPPSSPAKITWHVPHRIREGYGMRATRLTEAAVAGVTLVISVDTGIRAFAAAEEARELGLDLIVTDHHLPDEQAGIPDALAVLDPSQPGCPYPFKYLCGAAIAFKLGHALLLSHAALQIDPNQFLDRLRERTLPSLLKLVAIATIADSVPLVGENRVLASLGLRALANPMQPGLRELMRVADLPLDRSPTATEVSFRIAPRINAAGRMDVADDVIELFITRSVTRATELAEKLNTLNEERRDTEREALEEIEKRLAAMISAEGVYPSESIVLDHPSWHRGVVGILASRVVERTGRPALVITHDLAESSSSPQAHGSGRSVAGFHLLNALSAIHDAECDEVPAGTLFTRFGGHAHAVGFSLPSANVPLLRRQLQWHSSKVLAEDLSQPAFLFDSEIPLESLNHELCRWLERCAPFGNGQPEPIFVTRNLLLAGPVRLIKDRHICLSLIPAEGSPPLQALGWSRETDWVAKCRANSLQAGSAIDVAYRLHAKAGPWFTGLELDLVQLRCACA